MFNRAKEKVAEDIERYKKHIDILNKLPTELNDIEDVDNLTQVKKIFDKAWRSYENDKRFGKRWKKDNIVIYYEGMKYWYNKNFLKIYLWWYDAVTVFDCNESYKSKNSLQKEINECYEYITALTAYDVEEDFNNILHIEDLKETIKRKYLFDHRF